MVPFLFKQYSCQNCLIRKQYIVSHPCQDRSAPQKHGPTTILPGFGKNLPTIISLTRRIYQVKLYFFGTPHTNTKGIGTITSIKLWHKYLNHRFQSAIICILFKYWNCRFSFALPGLLFLCQIVLAIPLYLGS